ncbi:MAG: hypothetical protein CO096_30985 [Armatimonadetes bacterium CG_4_9_14_3_um_filter_66_14]|nr:MAG: hypothetical protein CO096_30985 [Armatimonadetes bacterium CG_4_9_14_3_um_filter_66_14]
MDLGRARAYDCGRAQQFKLRRRRTAMRRSVWTVAWLLGLVISGGSALAQGAGEIAELKRAIADLQKRLQEIEDKQKQETEQRAKAPQPVAAGFGKIKIGGLMQSWYSTDSEAADSVRLRRMELSLSGEITPKVTWRTMFDTTKVLGLNTTTAGGNVTSVAVNAAGNVLQDMLISYALSPELALDVGQYKVPMSMEGLRSSSELLTVERALFNTGALGIRAGRVGDVRDVGAQLRGKYPGVEFAVGLFNDGGPRQNATDDNDQKALLGRLVHKPRLPDGQTLQLGLYGAEGDTTAARTKRNRLGAELSYNNGPQTLELEAVRADDAAVRSDGGYLLYGYRLNDTWQVVARYEQWDPSKAVVNDRERDYLLGATYFLKGKNAKLQLNLVRKDMDAASPFAASRTQLLINFQTAW